MSKVVKTAASALSERCVLGSPPAATVPFIQGYGEIQVGHAVGGGAASRCPTCGYVCFPLPDPAEHKEYLTGPWAAASRSWRNPDADFADWRRAERADTIFRLVKPFGFDRRSSFHEVDCGFGGTVYEMQTRGVVASGGDIDKAAIVEGRSFGVTATKGLSESHEVPADGPVDVMFSFYAIERQQDLRRHMAGLMEHLSEDGAIVVVTANGVSLNQLVYGTARHEWTDYPRRLHLLTPKSALCLAETVGLILLDISTRHTGVMEAARHAAMKPRGDSAVARDVGDWALEQALLADELHLVFATKSLAAVFPEHVAATHRKIETHAAFEKRQRELGAEAFLAEPWLVPPG